MSRLGSGRTRSVSAENPTGEKGAGGAATEGTGAGAARELGRGWKVSPSIEIAAGATATLADLRGPGFIRHLWLTVHPDHWRSMVLRFFWDDASSPAVAVPLGDFFCQGWGEYAHVNSVPVAVNPFAGCNSYWEMPFRGRARLEVENLGGTSAVLYYQVDVELDDVPEQTGYLHAAWRRSKPLTDRHEHTLLDGVAGPGHYVGTYLAWGSNSSGWWGEGEMKFYLDGDDEFPTICGTGTEDYFGGAWAFEVPEVGYVPYSTAFLGLPQVLRSQHRFGMYRWHLPDPIRFEHDLRVTVQALGWRSGGRYLPLHDDIASTAWWYAADPEGTEGPALERDLMEVN